MRGGGRLVSNWVSTIYQGKGGGGGGGGKLRWSRKQSGRTLRSKQVPATHQALVLAWLFLTSLPQSITYHGPQTGRKPSVLRRHTNSLTNCSTGRRKSKPVVGVCSVTSNQPPNSQPTIQHISQATSQPTSQPAADLPANPPAKLPASHQQTYQPTKQTTHHPTHQSTYQPANKPTHQPTHQSTHQPTYQPTNQSTHHPTHRSAY